MSIFSQKEWSTKSTKNITFLDCGIFLFVCIFRQVAGKWNFPSFLFNPLYCKDYKEKILKRYPIHASVISQIF